MLDKSSLQTLTHDEMDILRRYFSLVVPPVILIEILGDLKKNKTRAGDPTVMGLARRIVPGASLPILPGFQDLIRAELDGVRIKMDCRPTILRGRQIAAESGEKGHEIPVQPEATLLLKWQKGEFTDGEELLAARYRESIKEFDIGAMQKSLHREYSPRLTLKSLQETADFVDDLIEGGNSESIIRWFVDDAFGNTTTLTSVLDKLPSSGRIQSRFPYLYHCLRISLIFHFATAFNLLSLRPTNRIDLEYLFYLPFTIGFSSGDKLHQQLFEFASIHGNEFIPKDRLKEDFGRLLKHEAETPDSAQAIHPPELSEESFTFRLWKKHMKPTAQSRDETMSNLSPEKEKLLMEHVRKLMSGNQDNEESGEGKDFLIRNYEITAESPCICGSQKSFGECHGTKRSSIG